MIDWSRIEGFDWDDGNRNKSLVKHAVASAEAEQVFQNTPLLVSADESHSGGEVRYLALGRTDGGRVLFVSFTLRMSGTLIRVISARPMKAKERNQYGQET
jgi:uncharacterized DUF497 family protein